MHELVRLKMLIDTYAEKDGLPIKWGCLANDLRYLGHLQWDEYDSKYPLKVKAAVSSSRTFPAIATGLFFSSEAELLHFSNPDFRGATNFKWKLLKEYD